MRIQNARKESEISGSVEGTKCDRRLWYSVGGRCSQRDCMDQRGIDDDTERFLWDMEIDVRVT